METRPLLVGAATVLYAALGYMTTGSPAKSAVLDKSAEAVAVDAVQVITENNRRVRMSLGAVNSFGAFLFAMQMAREGKANTPYELFITGSLVLVGAIFASTGYHSQWGKGARGLWNPDGQGWRRMPEGLAKAFRAKFMATNKQMLLGAAGLFAAIKFAQYAGLGDVFTL